MEFERPRSDSFSRSFERYLYATVGITLEVGARRFLQAHERTVGGDEPSIAATARRRDCGVDDLDREVMVDAVPTHLREFADEYRLEELATDAGETQGYSTG